jgi:uncharacterized protein (DUF433 family)
MTATKHEAALIDRYLEADPADPDPAAWRLKERAVPVWAIVGALTEARDNAAQVAADYGVSDQAIAAALAYYRQHGCLIDARLAANAA